MCDSEKKREGGEREGGTVDTRGEMIQKHGARVLQYKNDLTLVRRKYKINESLLVTLSCLPYVMCVQCVKKRLNYLHFTYCESIKSNVQLSLE